MSMDHGARGTADARRRLPQCAARSSRPRTRGPVTSRFGATASRPGASCISTTASIGIDKIMHCEELNATPINLGTSEMISINELVSIAEEIGGMKLKRTIQTRRAEGCGWPQQRQHDDQEHPQLGTLDPHPRRAQDDLSSGSSSNIKDRKAGSRTVRDIA